MRQLNALLSFLKDEGKRLDDRVINAALSLLKGEEKPAGVNVVVNLLTPKVEEKPEPKKVVKESPASDVLAQAVSGTPKAKKFVDHIASL